MTRILVSLACVLSVFGSGPAQSVAPSATDDEILQALIPNGKWPEVENLKRFRRADEIRALKKAKATATGVRRDSIIWLLAALKYRYLENRLHVVKLFTSCHAQPYPTEGPCYDSAAERLMDLFRRGDYSLLKYLFEISPRSDGALSESLGVFFSNTLVSHPRVLLGELQRRGSLEEQKRICQAAAHEDGSGMRPQRLGDARQILSRQIARRDRLARVARVCLTQVNVVQKKLAQRP